MKTQAATVTADRLRSFLERIERLLEERKAIQSDIKDIFIEAKGVGYDVKTMRKILSLRAMDSADRAEQEALLDTYMVALGMTNGGAAREPTDDELEARATRIVTEVDMLMELVTDGQPPSIAAIREATGCSLGKASKLRGLVEDRISRSTPIEREMKSGGQPGLPARTADAGPEASSSPPDSEYTGARSTAEAGPEFGVGPATDPDMGNPISDPDLGIPTSVSTEDELTLPAHLDRRVRA